MEDDHDDFSLFEGTSYQGLRLLGKGGMGTIYLVVHRTTGRKLAAKVIHSHLFRSQQARDRFRSEAQSLGDLDHPHIVSIQGWDHTRDGRPFLVLEYLHGRSLTEELLLGPLGLDRALVYGAQMLSALQAAHERGILHRDIKPENIFLCAGPDGQACMKLLDFGLAKILPDAPIDSVDPLLVPTSTGIIVGTEKYLPAETRRGQNADERSDIYAAGRVIYAMLTGQTPHPPIRGLRTWRNDIPAALDELVLRALADDPAQRPTSASEFRQQLIEAGRANQPRSHVRQTGSVRRIMAFIVGLAVALGFVWGAKHFF